MPSTSEEYRQAARAALLGRNTSLSLATVLLAIPVAIATAVVVATTIGADRLAALAVETWTGQSAHALVFLLAATLVTVAAASAVVNSGFVPTYLLVASPLLGMGLARYGTEYALLGSTQVVSLSEAFVDGAGVGIGIGLPLAAVGFLLGVGLRRLRDSVSGGSNGPLSPNGV